MCPCPEAGQSLGSWLGCIGLSTEERERIEDQGCNVADLRKMLLEEAMAALRVNREKAGRIMRCSSSSGARASERASERLCAERENPLSAGCLSEQEKEGEREVERRDREVERREAGSRSLADLIVADDEATRSFCFSVIQSWTICTRPGRS